MTSWNKKIVAFAVISIITIAFSASCGARKNATIQDPATFDEGVVINGIRWATRNVDAPGTFAESPESFGMFFQWNRRKGWSATDYIVDYWGRSISTGTEWERENDPCPEGWRVPTRKELEFLQTANYYRTIQNGVNGFLFGTAPYQIFLPTVGFRCGWNRTLGGVDVIGNYWSSTQSDIESAIGLGLIFDNVYVDRGWRLNGFSVRCVAK